MLLCRMYVLLLGLSCHQLLLGIVWCSSYFLDDVHCFLVCFEFVHDLDRCLNSRKILVLKNGIKSQNVCTSYAVGAGTIVNF